MSIRNGATSKLQPRLGVLTGQCGNGGGAGTRAKAWRTCQDRERRSVFPSEVRAQATALACSLPKEKKVVLGRWSLAEIVKRLLVLQIATSISPSGSRRQSFAQSSLVVAMNHDNKRSKRYNAPERGVFGPETHLRRLHLCHLGSPVRQNSDHTAVPPEIAV